MGLQNNWQEQVIDISQELIPENVPIR